MRFALLGEHPDGLDLAGAVVDSGRHQLVALSAALNDESLRRLGSPRRVSDVEEILADPTVEAVIVAGSPAVRTEQLRRALQSERHVLCVHPAAEKPDGGYEAAMLQADTGYVLFPLLPEMLHPGIRRLSEFVDRDKENSPAGRFRLLLVERTSPGEVLDNSHEDARSLSVPGWDVLRVLGGELSEVASFSDGEELAIGRPALLAGRFDAGGLFQMTLLPGQPSSFWRLTIVGTHGRVVLTFPQGWHGPAFLEWHEGDERHEEYFERWDAWPNVLRDFELAGEGASQVRWQDEIRCLELDDAARGSVQRRRVNLMEYQEASEEVGFKGTMTLAGCGLLWCVLLLLVVSIWLPWLGWLILPLLVLFATMQFLRWIIPARPQKSPQSTSTTSDAGEQGPKAS